MMTYDIPGIEAAEISLTVEARLEKSGQIVRLEALKIERPYTVHYTVRCYHRQGVATPLPEVQTSTPQEAIRAALCRLATERE
jgi:hypothetical protein